MTINHGNNYYTRYAHLESLSVKKGDKVSQGEKVGDCGTTGMSTGCHLHFVLYKKVDGKLLPAKPEPMSGISGFISGGSYISNNYLNVTYFTFPNHSSQGFTCGYDTKTTEQTQADLNTWKIATDGTNPGVEEPELPKGMNTDQFRFRFSAYFLIILHTPY